MKIPVAVVGATGIAGQQVLAAREDHPYFEIAALAASERSASKTFEEAIIDANSGMRRWYVDGGEPPAAALKLEVQDAKAMCLDGIGLVFAAVESEAARELEPLYARHVPTISTARPYRMDPDVHRDRAFRDAQGARRPLRRGLNHRHNDAGNLGRRPRPARARYRREHRPVHSARGRARHDRDAQNPWTHRRGGHRRTSNQGERYLHARIGARRPYRIRDGGT